MQDLFMRPQWINSYLAGKELNFLAPIVYQQVQAKYWNSPLLSPSHTQTAHRFRQEDIHDAIELRLRMYIYRFPKNPQGQQCRDEYTFYHAPGALDFASRVDYTKAAQAMIIRSIELEFEAAAWPAPSRSVLLFVAMQVMHHKEIAAHSPVDEFIPKAVEGPAQLGVVPCYSAAENHSFLETAFPFEVDTGTPGSIMAAGKVAPSKIEVYTTWDELSFLSSRAAHAKHASASLQLPVQTASAATHPCNPKTSPPHTAGSETTLTASAAKHPSRPERSTPHAAGSETTQGASAATHPSNPERFTPHAAGSETTKLPEASSGSNFGQPASSAGPPVAQRPPDAPSPSLQKAPKEPRMLSPGGKGSVAAGDHTQPPAVVPPGQTSSKIGGAGQKEQEARQPPQSSSDVQGARLHEVSKLMNWETVTQEEFASRVLQMSADAQASKDVPKSPMAAVMHDCLQESRVEVAPGVYLNALTASGMAEMLPKMLSTMSGEDMATYKAAFEGKPEAGLVDMLASMPAGAQPQLVPSSAPEAAQRPSGSGLRRPS